MTRYFFPMKTYDFPNVMWFYVSFPGGYLMIYKQQDEFGCVFGRKGLQRQAILEKCREKTTGFGSTVSLFSDKAMNFPPWYLDAFKDWADMGRPMYVLVSPSSVQIP